METIYFWKFGLVFFFWELIAYRRRKFRRSIGAVAISVRRLGSILWQATVVVFVVVVDVGKNIVGESVAIDTAIAAIIGHNRGAFQRLTTFLQKKIQTKNTNNGNIHKRLAKIFLKKKNYLIGGHGDERTAHADGSHGGHGPRAACWPLLLPAATRTVLRSQQTHSGRRKTKTK